MIIFELDNLNNIWKFASSEIADVSGVKKLTKSDGASKGIRCDFYFAFDFEIQAKFERLSNTTESITLGDTEDASATEFVNTVIIEGIKRGASDVHLEPRKTGIRTRYRIDGLLAHNEIRNIDSTTVRAIISRVKILGMMDIASSRKPQDGIIKDFMAGGKRYDLRVSSIQIVHGEKIVIRISPKEENIKTFEELGFLKEDTAKLNRILNKTTGILYVAGATGSGKTTTLYSIIDKLNMPDKNICTVEDPVEREIIDVNQVQVTSQDGTTGLKYADYLRAFLRQDPDIIIVGETRDKETADISMRASLTGHLVVSTIHSNSALETINRMYDMEIDTFILSTTLEGLIGQRLARKTCPKCGTLRNLTEAEKNYVNRLSTQYDKTLTLDKVNSGPGCDYCNHTGYKGRVVIAEVIEMDSTLRKLINAKASTEEIEKYLTSTGHMSLELSGLQRAIDGTTDIKELLRIV